MTGTQQNRTTGSPIPLRLYTKEVLEIVGVCLTTWKKLQNKGAAPLPKYAGKGGYVYLGVDIERFMGLTEYEKHADDDPFMQGVEKLGGVKK